MKTLAGLATTILLALGAATAAAAPSTTASTSLGGAPTSGQTLAVTFTLFTTKPVVPYEYALENVCITTRSAGHYTIGQHDEIVTWTDTDDGTPTGNPQVTMPVYLQSVPTGSSCRVSLVTSTTAVKGSTMEYTVG
jgi:hypothetical protein